VAENRFVGTSQAKIDALALATGQERFTADFPLPPGTLHCALAYSPHAFAEITAIEETAARAVPGVVEIFSHRNVPRVLHTTAGQGFPEPSPYDNLLFDTTVRFVGDRVALVCAENAEAAREGVQKLLVEYRVLEPVFDPQRALEPGSPRIPCADAHAAIPVAYEPDRNLAAEVTIAFGDPDQAFREAARAGAGFVAEQEYSLPFASHCAQEPHAALSWLDERGRLTIVSTTQVPFHARRIVSKVLEVPLHRIRVIKPRIGGGFGGKQEVILEPLVGLVTWRTGRPARLVLSRREVFVSCRTRHPARTRLKSAVDADGRLIALEMHTVLNTGAYGSHGLTVLSNVGSKTLPLFNKVEHLRFHGRSAYTNLPVAGAYRGYGATQGYFALNQHIDELARRAGRDVLELIAAQHIRAGETSGVFQALGEGTEGVSQVVRSCGLEACLAQGAEAIGWKKLRGRRLPGEGGPDQVKGVGVAVSMQGSGIPRIDMAAASMKMNDDGSFNLQIGATDIGTGSDTILAQIAAEVLQTPLEKIVVFSSDTDLTPFDTGAYASSTTYVSGKAVERCARELARQILERAALILGSPAETLVLEDQAVRDPATGASVSFEQICCSALYSLEQRQIQAQASYACQESPPPFIAQFAEVEVDTRTGQVEVKRLVSAVDCGRPINPVLAEGQVEGAALNGINYALWEEYRFDSSGRMANAGFWDYKVFTAKDAPEIRTILVDSAEPSGPFGAKSVGEVAINGPAPAIANAVFDAVGVRIRDLPITPEKVWRGLQAVPQHPTE
jgi:putative selenate reductase molybdopterin-binding subunit